MYACVLECLSLGVNTAIQMFQSMKSFPALISLCHEVNSLSAFFVVLFDFSLSLFLSIGIEFNAFLSFFSFLSFKVGNVNDFLRDLQLQSMAFF